MAKGCGFGTLLFVTLPVLLALLCCPAGARSLQSSGDATCRQDSHGRLIFRGATACDLSVHGIDAALGAAAGTYDGTYSAEGCHGDWPMYNMVQPNGAVRVLWRSSLSQEWRFDNLVSGFSEDSPGALPQSTTSWQLLSSAVDPINPMPAENRQVQLSVQCAAAAKPPAGPAKKAAEPQSPPAGVKRRSPVPIPAGKHSAGGAAVPASAASAGRQVAGHSSDGGAAPAPAKQPAAPATQPSGEVTAGSTTPTSQQDVSRGTHTFVGEVAEPRARQRSQTSGEPAVERKELRMGAELAIIFLFVTMLMSVSFSGAMFAICNGMPMSRRGRGAAWHRVKSYDAFERVDREDDYSVLPAGTTTNSYLLC